MIVKFKKLHEKAVLPSYAKKGDAGLDITCIDYDYITPLQIKYYTGLAIEIPEGYVGLIYPRSSIVRTCLKLSNSVGVIDSGYRGEIFLIFDKINNGKKEIYEVGDRIGQIIIIPYPIIIPRFIEENENLSESERGDGGYGSTGH